jgi:Ca2+-binding RTX toxin-like protein
MQQSAFQLCDLEPRRLFATDFSGSLALAQGFYAANDLVELSVSITNSGGQSAPIATVSVEFFLSTDTVVGNGDDIVVGGTSNTSVIPAGGTRSYPTGFAIQSTTPAGDYYVIGQMVGVNETNFSNNTAVSDGALVRVVTAPLTNPTILGTAGNDVITFEQHAANTVVTINGASSTFTNGAFPSLFVDGGLGNDRIFVTNAEVDIPLNVTGGGGWDTIIGGNANDELSGGLGRDKVWGSAGNDLLIGGAENDYLSGEAGDDVLIGAGGNDFVTDVVGRDWLIGGNGNDKLIALDLTHDAFNDPDTVSGNAGIDIAQIDDDGDPFADINSNIETFVA